MHANLHLQYKGPVIVFTLQVLTALLAIGIASSHASASPEIVKSPSKEPLVDVLHGRLEDFIGRDNALRDIKAILADDSSYLTGYELPIEVSTFSLKDQKAMASVLTHHDGRDWMPIVGANYLKYLSAHAQQTVAQFALRIFNKLYPTAVPKIDLEENADLLRGSFYLSQVRPNYSDLGKAGPIGVEKLFSDHAVDYLFRMPEPNGETGYLNCAANVFASLLAGADQHTGRYVGADSLDPLFKTYFEEVKPPLQLGDVVRYYIPGNFHVFVYAGTDRKTGQRIGFTKNGKELGVFTFMKEEDIYRLYQPFGITEVKYYRLIKALPQNLFDQFSAVSTIPESSHIENRKMILPELNQIISKLMSPANLPLLRGDLD